MCGQPVVGSTEFSFLLSMQFPHTHTHTHLDPPFEFVIPLNDLNEKDHIYEYAYFFVPVT